MRFRGTVCALAVAATAALSGCSGDDPGPQTVGPVSSSAGTTTSAAPTSTTSAAPTAEEQIASQWKGYWTTLLEVQGKSDAEIEFGLTPYTTVEQIMNVLPALRKLRASGQKQEGGLNFGTFSITILSPGKAQLKECRSVSDVVTKDSSGKVVARLKGERGYTAGFDLVEGRVWQVRSVDVNDGGCA